MSQKPVSGVVLATHLGISRSAVWKRIQHLRDNGFEIETKSGQGYFLKHPIEWLDQNRICDYLSNAAKKQLGDFHIAEQIDSTNSWAKFETKQQAGTDIFLAEQQTAGRGRLGRQWASPMAANIYLSLRRRFNKGLPALSGLSLVVGVLLAKTLRSQGFTEVGLKWPNDIVVDGKKCAGILIETQGDVFEPASLVIGIGVNYRLHPEHKKIIDQPVWDYATNVVTAMPRDALLLGIFRHLWERISTFNAHGFAPLKAAWLKHHACANKPVTASFGDGRKLDGVVVDVAVDGALILQVGNRREVIYSGEVSLRQA